MTSPLLTYRPTVNLPGQWTFWADMIRGNVPLGPVDVSGFGCTSRLSGFGNATGTFALPCGIDEARLLRLWSWRLWCYYDGELYWCGVPSGVSDENGSVRATLTFTELPGYLKKRQFDFWPKADFRQDEQTNIARIIAEPLADVGVRVVLEPGPGVLRDRTYEFLEGGEGGRAQLLSNLAGVLDGPEFRAEYDVTAEGRPRCTLRIAYPRVGGPTGLGVTVPGAALTYRAQWDADQLRTTTFAVGDLPENAPEGTPKPCARVDRPQDDLPRLDAVDDWPGTFLQQTLNERAATMAVVQAAPALALSASPPESLPPITHYRVGDDVTINATTPLMPGGLTVTGRLTEVSVSAGEATATWTVSAPSPPPVPRETVARRLDRLDVWTRQMFHSGGIAQPPQDERG